MIKAIETRYKGYRFRSRLEARWAVFFDVARIKWEYEIEGYELPSGWYLPDFFLPELKKWIEIKGNEVTEKDRQLCCDLAEATAFDCYIFGSFRQDGDSIDEGEACYASGSWDNSQSFCTCSTGLHVEIHFDGRGSRIDCGCVGHHYIEGGRGHSANHPRLVKARNAARSARFEHGERGVG